MTVERLDSEVSGVKSYVQWMAYFEKEPPAEVSWMQTAEIAYTIYRMAGGKKLKRADFMPSFSITKEGDDIAESIEMFETLAKDSGSNA